MTKDHATVRNFQIVNEIVKVRFQQEWCHNIQIKE